VADGVYLTARDDFFADEGDPRVAGPAMDQMDTVRGLGAGKR
jgi:hypothetical protein